MCVFVKVCVCACVSVCVCVCVQTCVGEVFVIDNLSSVAINTPPTHMHTQTQGVPMKDVGMPSQQCVGGDD